MRPVHGWLEPGWFALWTRADRATTEQSLQLFDDLLQRSVAVEQFDQLLFDRMEGYGLVDLPGIFMCQTLLSHLGIRGLDQDRFQVAQKQCRVKILPHRLGCMSAEVFQVQSSLDYLIEGLMSPAPVIHFQ